MKTNIRNRAPIIITACALFLVSLLFVIGEATKEKEKGFRLDVFDRLECITYDARVRMAADSLSTNNIAPNLATLFIDDRAIEGVNDGVYGGYMAPAWDDGNIEGLNFPVPWPRFMYGQMVRELKAQGAKAVGFDILFSELDRKSIEAEVPINKTNYVTSDEFFAIQIEEAGNVVLATEGDLMPQEIFAEYAAAVGNIASANEYGVLRRVRAFGYYKVWHPKIREMARALDLRIRQTRLTTPGFVKIPFKPTPDEPQPGFSKFRSCPMATSC